MRGVGASKALATPTIVLAGLSFKSSCLRSREKFASLFPMNAPHRFLRSVPHVKESTLIATCNRLELYMVTVRPEETVQAIMAKAEQVLGLGAGKMLYIKTDRDAISHAFRVAAGLDSLVIGEEEIVQQMKEGSTAARVSGDSGSILASLFDEALNAGKRVRNSCGRTSPRSSVSSLAISFAVSKLGKPPSATLLIGTGKTARAAASRLEGSKIYVASNRPEAPKSILPNAILIKYSDIPGVLGECDLVVVATTTTASGNYVLNGSNVACDKPLLLLDLAFPRNVDPELRSLPSVRLFDLDDISAHARTIGCDSALAATGEELLAKEVELFARWLTASRLSPTLRDLYRWAEEVRSSETEAAVRRLAALSEDDRRTVEALSRRIVSKLLAPPTAFVRTASSEYPQSERLKLVESVFRRDDREASSATEAPQAGEQKEDVPPLEIRRTGRTT